MGIYPAESLDKGGYSRKNQACVCRLSHGSALCVREVLSRFKVLELNEQGRLWLKQEAAGGLSVLCSRTLDLRPQETTEGFKSEHWHARFLFQKDYSSHSQGKWWQVEGAGIS